MGKEINSRSNWLISPLMAHGELDNITDYAGMTQVKLAKSGTIYAMSYCNIHGVWENSKDISVE